MGGGGGGGVSFDISFSSAHALLCCSIIWTPKGKHYQNYDCPLMDCFKSAWSKN